MSDKVEILESHPSSVEELKNGLENLKSDFEKHKKRSDLIREDLGEALIKVNKNQIILDKALIEIRKKISEKL
jgi:hypothetical protein